MAKKAILKYIVTYKIGISIHVCRLPDLPDTPPSHQKVFRKKPE
jgi:hypothetical protein